MKDFDITIYNSSGTIMQFDIKANTEFEAEELALNELKKGLRVMVSDKETDTILRETEVC